MRKKYAGVFVSLYTTIQVELDTAELAVIDIVTESGFELDTLEVVESALNLHITRIFVSQMSRT